MYLTAYKKQNLKADFDSICFESYFSDIVWVRTEKTNKYQILVGNWTSCSDVVVLINDQHLKYLI